VPHKTTLLEGKKKKKMGGFFVVSRYGSFL